MARGRHPPARPKLNPLGYPVLDPTTKGTTRSEARPTRWRLLALLIAMTGVSSLSLNILVPAIPSLVAKFAADPASVQLTVSLYLLGLAVAQLVFGPLSDRFGRRPVVLAGLALATIASTAAIFAASIFEPHRRPRRAIARRLDRPNHRTRDHPRSVRSRARSRP